jgi:hypothetical protein
MALDIAILCFCPPDIYDPLGPTYLSKPVPSATLIVVFSESDDLALTESN